MHGCVMTRLLAIAALVLVSGCSCNFELFPPDECFEDSECDNGVVCDGLEQCAGFFTLTCQGGPVPCDVCDSVADMCVDCDFEPDHPLCPWRPPDAGTPLDAMVEAGPCDGVTCDLDEQCAVFRGEPAACYPRCPVGQERDLHLGPRGRGERCPEASACYSVGDPAEPERGICAPGNYNPVTEPNVGAPCTDDAECFSPYGRGRCANLDTRPIGVCEVTDCAGERELWPGVRTRFDVCPAPAICDTADHTCRAQCAAADQCPVGHACAVGRCVATCTRTHQCRGNERCVDELDVECSEEDDACTCERIRL